jgi:hypothetical protein
MAFTYAPRHGISADRALLGTLEGLSAWWKVPLRIGTSADRLRTIELVRRFLIVAICGLAAVLVVQLFSGGTLAIPW